MTTDEYGWTEETLPFQRREASYHEAAHALAARLLGLPVDHVSIRRGDHFFGITSSGRGPVPEWNGLPGALYMNSGLRQFIERQIVTDLAGHIGSLASWEPYDEFAEIDNTWAHRAAAALDAVSPRTRELILASEASPATKDDETRARELAEKWSTFDSTPPSSLTYYIEWLRGESRDLLADHADQLKAIADQLSKRVILTGPQVDEILRGLPQLAEGDASEAIRPPTSSRTPQEKRK
jgi:hypothetical protein